MFFPHWWLVWSCKAFPFTYADLKMCVSMEYSLMKRLCSIPGCCVDTVKTVTRFMWWNGRNILLWPSGPGNRSMTIFLISLSCKYSMPDQIIFGVQCVSYTFGCCNTKFGHCVITLSARLLSQRMFKTSFREATWKQVWFLRCSGFLK